MMYIHSVGVAFERSKFFALFIETRDSILFEHRIYLLNKISPRVIKFLTLVFFCGSLMLNMKVSKCMNYKSTI